jgi:hypothetical protein
MENTLLVKHVDLKSKSVTFEEIYSNALLEISSAGFSLIFTILVSFGAMVLDCYLADYR